MICCLGLNLTREDGLMNALVRPHCRRCPFSAAAQAAGWYLGSESPVCHSLRQHAHVPEASPVPHACLEVSDVPCHKP